MEKTKLFFIGDDNVSQLNAYALFDTLLVIDISEENSQSSIVLNKKTAIKLAKELRKQISYLED